MNSPDKIFSRSGCLTQDMLYGYLNETLSNKDKHIVEKHLMDCDMCSDALEGLSLVVNRENIPAIVTRLNEQIRQKTAKSAKPEAKTFSLNRRTVFAIAAGLALVIGVSLFVNSYLQKKNAEEVFSQNFAPYPAREEKKKEERIVLTDSLSPAKEQPAKQMEADKKAGPEEKIVLRGSENKPRQSSDLQQKAVNDETVATKAETESFKNEPAPVNVTSSGSGSKNEKSGKSGYYRDDYANGAVSGSATTTTKSPSGNNNATPQSQTGSISLGKKENQKDLELSNKEDEVSKSAKLDARSSGETETVTGAGKDEYKKGKKFRTARRKTRALSEPPSTADAKIQDKEKNDQKSAKDTAKSFGLVFNSVTQNVRSDTATVLPSQVKSPSEKGMARYEAKDYDGALQSFDQALKQDPQDERSLFYSGVSYLSSSKPDPDKAIVNFDKILQNDKSQYYEAAKWYKALACVKKNDKLCAKQLLEDISGKEGTYRKQAKKTLDEIK